MTAHRSRRSLPSLHHALALLVSVVFSEAYAQETIVPLVPMQLSATTGEKPQSKVWFHDDRWWAVVPSTSVTPTGMWLWRLGTDHQWTNMLRLSASTSAKADVKAVGDVAHVLLHTGSSNAQLVSLEYRPAEQTYVLWPARPTTTSIPLTSSEIATIDIDSTGRMWLATDTSTDMIVYYSDPPYVRFDGPIALASGTSTDDISAVTAIPLPGVPSIGVLWSNQNTQLFGFRLHVDGLDPLMWLADEMPAHQSALHVGHGMADDHLHFAVAADGTLYAAVKTSYDTTTYPKISLLKRHPGGEWDDLYYVDDQGTRGIVLLNEPADLLRVIYRDDSGDNIVYRDSLPSIIGFSARHTLIPGPRNDPTSTKENWTDQVVVLAEGAGAMILRQSGTTTTTGPTTTTIRATTTTSTSTTRPPTTTSTSTTTSISSTTTTTLPPGVTVIQIRVAASADDAEESSTGSVSLTSGDLELTFDKTQQTVGVRFRGVTVPRGATIVGATVQFQVDEATSEATTITIQGEASDQAAAFTTASGNVSSRPRTAAAVSWSIDPWPTVGGAGPAQRTPGLAAVIQEIVNRPAWASGNPLALVITGTGHRVAVAYDKTHAAAPLLRLEYAVGTGGSSTSTTTASTTTTSSTTTTGPTTTSTTITPSSTTTTLPPGVSIVQVRVAASADDAEESSAGSVNLTSSDLELTFDKSQQTVGMRFRGVTVPPGATIVGATVQFQVDEATSEVTTITIQGEASDQAAAFTTASGNVSSRPRTTAAVSWSIDPWPTVGVAGPAQQTPGLAAVIQEIVNRPAWASGNPLALVITGTGHRVGVAYDGIHASAPLLRIEYGPRTGATTTSTSTTTTSTSTSTSTSTTSSAPTTSTSSTTTESSTSTTTETTTSTTTTEPTTTSTSTLPDTTSTTADTTTTTTQTTTTETTTTETTTTETTTSSTETTTTILPPP